MGRDLAFLVAADLALSWSLHPELLVPGKVLLQGVLPFGFYLWSRLSVDDGLIDRLRWLVLALGTLGALSVLYEALRGVAVFVDPQIYQWSGTSTTVFRAGGVFGGSPTAATFLACVILFSASLYRERPRLVLPAIVIMVAAICATLDRAGIVALACGVVTLAILLPYRRWGRVLVVALALTIPVYAVATSPGCSTGCPRASSSPPASSARARSAVAWASPPRRFPCSTTRPLTSSSDTAGSTRSNRLTEGTTPIWPSRPISG